ncbi:MAG: putative selenium-dependent hydroxylase accessory protein YqeC [Mogibacterium sp.]|nr:putative selenium-dependent hydroxylase accessory protein YqeC [Mogibacterium sp.]
MRVKPVLLRQLNIDPAVHKTISIVGAGGKTSLMKRLCDELISLGLRVILTTSTHILYEEPETFVRIFDTGLDTVSADAGRVKELTERYGYAVIGCIGDDACPGQSKISSPGEAVLKQLSGLCDVVLIEADGARGKSIKIPAAWEPARCPRTDLGIAVAGAGAIGQRIMDAAYRPEEFARFVCKDAADRISCDDVAEIASSAHALRKNAGEKEYRFYLNAVDNIYDTGCYQNTVIDAANVDMAELAHPADPYESICGSAHAADIMEMMSRLGRGHNIEASCGSVRNADSMGAVILAAGLGTRFGGGKLKSLICGKPMFMHVLDELARIFGYEQITFVTGGSDIADAAAKTGAHVVINPRPENGISTSMKLGLSENLHRGSCLFAVADQPFISSGSIRRLVHRFTQSDRGMAAMTDSRGEFSNPCIFSSRYYVDLYEISGDRGGKGIIRRHPDDVYTCKAVSEKELQDIDTIDDLEQIVGRIGSEDLYE